MKKLILVLLLLPLPFLAQAEKSDKDWIIERINDVCTEHSDPSFCRWQVENIAAISGIVTLSYSNCYLKNDNSKECQTSTDAYNYIQKKYKENMADTK
ncbi:hypothetical protein [Morganella psychrotolerans]|uniref:DUF1311 domain-containing protein n=1 Tax=Morganella psychrotolerans TaxID=368603 RepID=A0A1B8HFB0_9GAMM|nr:hypothetical protein [Morganella psychrotolerans]OBU07757.1 hypothetical protein AYY18_05920 [Morganella psychrotolerans]